MWEGRGNGLGVDGEGGGGSAAAAGPVGVVTRRRRQPYSDPSSSGSVASSSSGGREAEAEAEAGEGGGKKKQGRRKGKSREVVVRAIRDRLPAPPSCWGNASAAQVTTGRSRTGERPRGVGRGGGGVGGAVEEDDSGAGTAAPPAWCCLCADEDCSLEPNPSANGKEDAGLRSLIERNDFYSDDCNPHAAAAAASVASPGADFD